MMHHEQRSLLDAIRQDPSNWDTRLVYADWLDDNTDNVACYNCDGEGNLVHHHNMWCPYCDGVGHERMQVIRKANLIRLMCKRKDYFIEFGRRVTNSRWNWTSIRRKMPVGKEYYKAADDTVRAVRIRGSHASNWHTMIRIEGGFVSYISTIYSGWDEFGQLLMRDNPATLWITINQRPPMRFPDAD